MTGLAYVAAAASLAFYVFLGWGILSHVKEQRRQSALLARIAEQLEQSKRDS